MCQNCLVKTIHSVNSHFGWDHSFTPVERVAPGSTLQMNCRDSSNGYFTALALADYRSSLAALGPPTSFVAIGSPRLRGGFVNRNYRIVAGGKTLRLITYAEPGPSGRWEQYIDMPQ